MAVLKCNNNNQQNRTPRIDWMTTSTHTHIANSTLTADRQTTTEHTLTKDHRSLNK